MPKLEDIERGLLACKVHDDDIRWMAEVIQREIRAAVKERAEQVLDEYYKRLHYKRLHKEGKI